MMDKTFNKKDIDTFKNMGYEEKKSMIFKLPIKALVPLYLNYCDRKQIIDILTEWDSLLSYSDDDLKIHGEPNKLRKRYNKLIPSLLKGLKKSRKLFFVPTVLRSKYGF